MNSVNYKLETHKASDLITLFDNCFSREFNTVLVGGASEPLYQPAETESAHHQIIFTQDYFASALHEIAHWCVAGEWRRSLIDYGYWYAPDGRSVEQQREFERVEVKPQALEWIFAYACHFKFQISADNLQAGAGASQWFREAIAEQARSYCLLGLNNRARRFVDALAQFYGSSRALVAEAYCVEQLS